MTSPGDASDQLIAKDKRIAELEAALDTATKNQVEMVSRLTKAEAELAESELRLKQSREGNLWVLRDANAGIEKAEAEVERLGHFLTPRQWRMYTSDVQHAVQQKDTFPRECPDHEAHVSGAHYQGCRERAPSGFRYHCDLPDCDAFVKEGSGREKEPLSAKPRETSALRFGHNHPPENVCDPRYCPAAPSGVTTTPPRPPGILPANKRLPGERDMTEEERKKGAELLDSLLKKSAARKERSP